MKSIRKEVVMACFKILSQNLLGRLRRATKNFSQHSRFLGRDLNPEPAKHEAEIVTTF